jgi:hypothetical protein
LNGVAPVIFSGEEDGRVYYAMDLINGETLEQWLQRKGRTDLGIVARLMADVALIVHTVHELGVVHRDIKPPNIMLDTRGKPVLIDFGLASPLTPTMLDARGIPFRIDSGLASPLTPTRDGPVAWGPANWSGEEVAAWPSNSRPTGTLIYAAPERCLDRTANFAMADIFSIGATLWQLLTGQWTMQEWEQACRGCLDARPLLHAGVPRDLGYVCLRALARRPQDRYSSAKELAEELSHVPSSLVFPRQFWIHLRYSVSCSKEADLLTKNGNGCEALLGRDNPRGQWECAGLREAERSGIARRIAEKGDRTLDKENLVRELSNHANLDEKEALASIEAWFRALGKTPAAAELLWPSLLFTVAGAAGALIGLVFASSWGILFEMFQAPSNPATTFRFLTAWICVFMAALGGLSGTLRRFPKGYRQRVTGRLIGGVIGATLGAFVGVGLMLGLPLGYVPMEEFNLYLEGSLLLLSAWLAFLGVFFGVCNRDFYYHVSFIIAVCSSTLLVSFLFFMLDKVFPFGAREAFAAGMCFGAVWGLSGVLISDPSQAKGMAYFREGGREPSPSFFLWLWWFPSTFIWRSFASRSLFQSGKWAFAREYSFIPRIVVLVVVLLFWWCCLWPMIACVASVWTWCREYHTPFEWSGAILLTFSLIFLLYVHIAVLVDACRGRVHHQKHDHFR